MCASASTAPALLVFLLSSFLDSKVWLKLTTSVVTFVAFCG